MRSFFVVSGLLMAAPQFWFLFIHRPPVSFIPERLPGHRFKFYAPHRRWWLATSLRLLSFSVFSNGVRILGTNVKYIDKPYVTDSWIDTAWIVSTIGVGALASVVFFAVYLRYRDWKVT